MDSCELASGSECFVQVETIGCVGYVRQVALGTCHKGGGPRRHLDSRFGLDSIRSFGLQVCLCAALCQQVNACHLKMHLNICKSGVDQPTS